MGDYPTNSPTDYPTKSPTSSPTEAPSQFPTRLPTPMPTNSTLSPSMSPTSAPIFTNAPTMELSVPSPEQVCAAVSHKAACKVTPGCYFGEKADGPCSLFSGVCENITNKKTCKAAEPCVSKKVGASPNPSLSPITNRRNPEIYKVICVDLRSSTLKVFIFMHVSLRSLILSDKILSLIFFDGG